MVDDFCCAFFFGLDSVRAISHYIIFYRIVSYRIASYCIASKSQSIVRNWHVLLLLIVHVLQIVELEMNLLLHESCSQSWGRTSLAAALWHVAHQGV